MIKTRGFTLIELLVVISIVALLASTVLASLNTARDKGRMGGARYFAAQVDHVVGEQAIGLWDFDECSGTTAIDRSGFGNDIVLTGTPSFSPTIIPSNTGCSLSFNGSTQYGTGPSISTLNGSSFTVGAWAKRTSNGAYDTILGLGTSGVLDQYLFFGFRNNNVFTCALWADDLDTAAYTDSDWHYWTCTFTAPTKSLKIYRDGIQVASRTSIGIFSGVGPVSMGQAAPVGVGFFHGYLDNVHLYTKDLTALEIQRIYASSVAQFAFSTPLR